jgi:hypothetical protein
MCFDFLYKFFFCKISHSKKNSARYDQKCIFVCVYILVNFQRHLNFLERFSKNAQISNFMKFRPVDTSCSLRTDGRPDMSKLIVVFHNFGKAPKNHMRVCESVIGIIREGVPKSKHVVKQQLEIRHQSAFTCY